MNRLTEYDIWTDSDGRARATLSTKVFVDDSDAPYGYEKHQVRLDASSKRSAMNMFRKLR
ncbi:hypothetical protein A3715_15585 [Oleiphilus sp. HI0009]|nr:hypothetical protein A3715_15585 [Oleiphilus sp. HI0009]